MRYDKLGSFRNKHIGVGIAIGIGIETNQTTTDTTDTTNGPRQGGYLLLTFWSQASGRFNPPCAPAVAEAMAWQAVASVAIVFTAIPMPNAKHFSPRPRKILPHNAFRQYISFAPSLPLCHFAMWAIK